MARTASFAILAFLLLRCVSAFKVLINADVSHVPTSPQEASFALSRHLGLEAFEPDNHAVGHHHNHDGNFVGQDWKHTALIALDEEDVEAILPPSFSHLYTSSPLSGGSVDSVLSTFKHRAEQVYASVYSPELSFQQLEVLPTISDFFAVASTPSFASLNLKYLYDIRQQHGSASDEYTEAVVEVESFLKYAFEDPSFHIAVITYTPPHLQMQYEREIARDHSPIPSVLSGGTCFSSANACQNSTNACSGRGECREAKRAGKTCYACACQTTKSGQGSKLKTENWVGDSCERKDVSGPFVLLTGTALVLVLLIVGSVSLLSAVGSVELPSTLLATAVPAKRD